MPRDGARTRARLIEVGRRLFATTGVYATPLKTIVDAAGQRNASALHYHFGSRQGLLEAIIATTNDDIERRRAVLLAGAGPDPTIQQLVTAWIVPQADLLGDPIGRQFLAIISQLNDLFDEWDAATVPAEALRTLQGIDHHLLRRVGVSDDAVRRERLTRFLELTAEALGSRARMVERAARPALAHEAWVANLTAMSVGALSATVADPARPSPRDHAGSR